MLLTPGTTLRIGPVTKKVLFTAGTTAASGTWIRGSRATLDVRGTTLGSVDTNGRETSAAGTAGSPYILMGAGGQLDITDSTITGFGLPGTGHAGFSGVTWGKGSTGYAVGSSFVGNRTGLRLAGSSGVRLSKVTVKGSVGDGVVLNGDTGTTVQNLTSQGNGRNGLAAGGTDQRNLSGISTGVHQLHRPPDEPHLQRELLQRLRQQRDQAQPERRHGLHREHLHRNLRLRGAHAAPEPSSPATRHPPRWATPSRGTPPLPAASSSRTPRRPRR
ncbi:hypothetical protein [Actinacidiphila oryziradicis]|uniref:Uncharacterized protein n=1 Tax=Actinacidiphila oryziradicis TaxID=2571141 RepID=A0A4U0T1N7_9ACTN|nr:hypothetical protein [Actinacidiphila oryziradicis]TKA06665.1 hypothetical protein FCI23_30230 [Actinacidiphila oryziradicis]